MNILSACSSKSKQEPAMNPVSASVQSAVPGQPGTAAAQPDQNNQAPVQAGEKPVNDTSGQNEAELEKTGNQQADTSIPDNTGQPQKENKDNDKVENKAAVPAKVYVFTNSAGCCEATRQKFEQHKNAVKQIENKYRKTVGFLWLDIATGDLPYQKDVYRYYQTFGIKDIPAIVVVDANNNVLLKQIGMPDMSKIDIIFSGVKV
jgi:hypothetical protein